MSAKVVTHNLDEQDVMVVAGSWMLTKEEVTSAQSLGSLLRSKADQLRESFLDSAAKEIEKRGWAVVEYRENTTGRV